MGVRLSICIQTHVARAALLTKLLVSLAPTNILVAHDPEPEARPSPLRSYLRALELLPPWATHHLVLQDDTEICADFQAAALLAIAARPDDPIAFFCPVQPPEMAHKIRCALERDESFAVIDPRRWAPVVALCWPVALVHGFLAYVEEQSWPHHFRADDEAVGRYFRESGIELLASAPSLVEHPDTEPSLIGRRVRGGRVAAHFIGAGEALTISWR